MTVSRVLGICLIVLTLGCAPGGGQQPQLRPTDTAGRVFEIRTYTTFEGRLDALNQRFRNHTMRFFEKHGMTNIGYWVPQDTALARNTLIYILAHPSREAARQSWAAFNADPEWQQVRRESEASGRIVERAESVFMDATDYSPMR